MNLERCSVLNNIPVKKLQLILSTVKEFDIINQSIKTTAINRYAESNIPVEYWDIKMSDFTGDQRLLTKYNNYISDLQFNYLNGSSICFSGQYGVGKTLTAASILKRAAAKGYSCLYSDMSTIISVLMGASFEEKLSAKRELSSIDFLVIDEVDPRFFNQSNATNELFARNLENIIRSRISNKLPTIICTNSPNITAAFVGTLRESITSLMSGYFEQFVVFGKDHRIK